jgi:hypothetical protein
MRRELLLPDYRKQAAQQVNPQFDRLTNQLQSQIAATRGRIPRQLLARGQAVGGQRTLQEGELDRQLAYGTADLEAQRQMAINQAAQGLRQQGLEQQRWETEQQFKERQLASDENRWQQDFEYGQEQDAFNNYVQQRKLELEEQGMAFDQAQAQAEFEYEQNRDAINDDFRRWQTSMMYGGIGTSGTGVTTGTPQEDLSAYQNIIEQSGYNAEQLMQYINAQPISDQDKQYLMSLYGVDQGGFVQRGQGFAREAPSFIGQGIQTTSSEPMQPPSPADMPPPEPKSVSDWLKLQEYYAEQNNTEVDIGQLADNIRTTMTSKTQQAQELIRLENNNEITSQQADELAEELEL